MAKTKPSAKSSKAPAATKKAAAKPAAKPAAKAAKADPKETRKEKTGNTDVKMGWSSAIKKALQVKGEQPNWPGSGDAWKRKNKI